MGLVRFYQINILQLRNIMNCTAEGKIPKEILKKAVHADILKYSFWIHVVLI